MSVDTVVLNETFAKVDDLVKDWCDEVTCNVSNFEDVIHTKIEQIDNEYRSGFIPYTEGGWDGLAFGDMGHAYGSGSTPKAIQPYVDSAVKEVEKEFEEEYGVSVSTLYDRRENNNNQLKLLPEVEGDNIEELLEKFHEMEDEYLSEGGTYFYKIRAVYYNTDNSRNVSGEPEVLFCVGINTDFEYGRDYIPWLGAYGSDPHCTKWVWEKNIKVTELTEELIQTLVNEATTALNDA